MYMQLQVHNIYRKQRAEREREREREREIEVHYQIESHMEEKVEASQMKEVERYSELNHVWAGGEGSLVHHVKLGE